LTKIRIYIAGHRGMVGSALIRLLKKNQNIEIITKDKSELNLINQASVEDFFKEENIDQVYIAAARVGGIYANSTFPAEFIYQNIMIQTNIIHSAFLNGVKKLMFLGSSCIYPKNINAPMKEKDLLTGLLEPTNEPYAIAKISGIKMCESYNRQYGKSHNLDYRSIMPTNIYGPGDNFHNETSHVIPALIFRLHKAKVDNSSGANIWGTGNAKREFLFVDDLARATIHIMNIRKEEYNKLTQPMCNHINIGSGEEVTIKKLAEMIKIVVGFKGRINYDTNKLDGNMRKLLDNKIIKSLDWEPKVNLENGLIETYKYFLDN
jgi:GDP-L-fucose synthase